MLPESLLPSANASKVGLKEGASKQLSAASLDAPQGSCVAARLPGLIAAVDFQSLYISDECLHIVLSCIYGRLMVCV